MGTKQFEEKKNTNFVFQNYSLYKLLLEYLANPTNIKHCGPQWSNCVFFLKSTSGEEENCSTSFTFLSNIFDYKSGERSTLVESFEVVFVFKAMDDKLKNDDEDDDESMKSYYKMKGKTNQTRWECQ